LDSLNIIIRGCSIAKELDRAYATFVELPSFGTSPSLNTFKFLLEGCITLGDTVHALRIMSELEKQKSIKPDSVTYEFLIQTFLAKDELRMAVNILHSLKKEEVQPTFYTLWVLAVKMVQARELGQALDIVEIARSLKYPTAGLDRLIATGGSDVDRTIRREEKERFELERKDRPPREFRDRLGKPRTQKATK